MRFRLKKKNLLLYFAALLLTASACGDAAPEPTVDPHAGMVQVSNGSGGMWWIAPSEVLPVSTFSQTEFITDGEGAVTYVGDAFTAHYGIDVSEHQGEVDWDAVADAGVEFAILRAGYRGWSEGTLNEDAYFAANLQGARSAGLRVGCYFFSQAVNPAEAEEEAAFLLSLLNGAELDLPVFFDWEEIGEEARTANAPAGMPTDGCLAFCLAVETAGYQTGVYFYRNLGYNVYDLEKLNGLHFWAGAIGDSPDFYYEHRFWQYSITGTVPGVENYVDRDIWFEPAPEITPSPDTEETPSPGAK
jgi:GH25 family lysozyme M1 (1,4-beta-N-acetylmuramidase)